jgi:hypothetical protein
MLQEEELQWLSQESKSHGNSISTLMIYHVIPKGLCCTNVNMDLLMQWRPSKQWRTSHIRYFKKTSTLWFHFSTNMIVSIRLLIGLVRLWFTRMVFFFTKLFLVHAIYELWQWQACQCPTLFGYAFWILSFVFIFYLSSHFLFYMLKNIMLYIFFVGTKFCLQLVVVVVHRLHNDVCNYKREKTMFFH